QLLSIDHLPCDGTLFNDRSQRRLCPQVLTVESNLINPLIAHPNGCRITARTYNEVILDPTTGCIYFQINTRIKIAVISPFVSADTSGPTPRIISQIIVVVFRRWAKASDTSVRVSV